MKHLLLWVAVLLTFVSAGAWTLNVEADESPAKHRVLIEVFTSQGCAGCAQVEPFLQMLEQQYGDRAVIVAWHVNYWDRLGFKDVFGKQEFATRHQAYVKKNGGGVQTPYVLIDTHNALGQDYNRLMQTALAKDALVSIDGSFTAKGNKVKADVSVEAIAKDWKPEKGMRVLPVLYQESASTYCDGGENKGKTLSESWIALETGQPVALNKALGNSLEVKFTLPKGTDAENVGVMIIVENTETSEIVECRKLPVKSN